MHDLEISSPNLVLLYQFPETELMRIKLPWIAIDTFPS